jgi:hypothetical protein
MHQNNILLFLTSTYQNNPKTPIKHQINTFSKNNNLKSTLKSKSYCKNKYSQKIQRQSRTFSFQPKKAPSHIQPLKQNRNEVLFKYETKLKRG